MARKRNTDPAAGTATQAAPKPTAAGTSTNPQKDVAAEQLNARKQACATQLGKASHQAQAQGWKRLANLTDLPTDGSASDVQKASFKTELEQIDQLMAGPASTAPKTPAAASTTPWYNQYWLKVAGSAAIVLVLVVFFVNWMPSWPPSLTWNKETIPTANNAVVKDTAPNKKDAATGTPSTYELRMKEMQDRRKDDKTTPKTSK